MANTTNLGDETSLTDILAADGARGFDENLKEPSIPQLKRAGLAEVSPGSDWYVPGAAEGDWFIGAGAHAHVLGKRFQGTPYYWRWLFDERRTIIGGKKKTEHVATWACEPKDAAYPPGLGYSRTSNKNLLSERVVIDLIHPGPDGPAPCRLMLFGKDHRRIAETFRQKLLAKRIRGADGQMKPAPLYACAIAITADERDEERGDKQGNPVTITVWDPVFTFLGLYGSAAGPDRETVLLGRDLCGAQEVVRYQNPNVPRAAPALRVVGSDTTPDETSFDDPPSPEPGDPGPTLDGEIPF
jgi:hypothetical protein